MASDTAVVSLPDAIAIASATAWAVLVGVEGSVLDCGMGAGVPSAGVPSAASPATLPAGAAGVPAGVAEGVAASGVPEGVVVAGVVMSAGEPSTWLPATVPPGAPAGTAAGVAEGDPSEPESATLVRVSWFKNLNFSIFRPNAGVFIQIIIAHARNVTLTFQPAASACAHNKQCRLQKSSLLHRYQNA